MRVMRPRGTAPTTNLTNYNSSSPIVTSDPGGTRKPTHPMFDEPTTSTPPTTTEAPPITHGTIKSTFGSVGTAPVAGDAPTLPNAPVHTQPVAEPAQPTWNSSTDDVKRALSILRGTDQMDYLNLLAVMEQNNGQLPTPQQRMQWDALQKKIYPNYANATQPVTPPPAPLNPNVTAHTYNPNDPDPFGWKAWGEAYGDKKPVSFGEWWQRIPEYQFLKSKAGVGGWFQANKAFYNQMLQQYRLYAGAFPNPYTGKLNQFGGRRRFFVSPGDQK